MLKVLGMSFRYLWTKMKTDVAGANGCEGKHREKGGQVTVLISFPIPGTKCPAPTI